MLRHDDNPEAASFLSAAFSSPAAQVRVTPQELATALARLEARQGGLEGTIPLGDAVQELALTVTPEELLREIEAGRARRSAAPARTRLARAGRAAVAAVLGGILLFGGLFAFRSEAPPLSTPAAISGPITSLPASITVPDTLLVRRPDHKMVLLSEAPDNQPVLCDLTVTDTGAALADFGINSHWTLIKHDGKTYLRGWIGDLSDAALRSTVVTIHPGRQYVSSGLHPIPVTLPVDGFQSLPGLTSDDIISAAHTVPDAHFQEKW